ncbi:OmpA family protein [Pseudomonas sp. SBB6]|uniref:OmpA family protein n=1 Tax=Pseudomonas sp. SBB6 TaxID=2962032 RepID=UPI0020B8ADE9|nr:OmpA family protein [Pseudomonas sp. SBB6]
MFELFKTYAPVVLQITITIGVIVTFCYWTFIINFYPTGITLSESLLFIFAALMFGLLYSFWFCLVFIALYGVVQFSSKKIKTSWGLALIGLLAGILLVLWAIGAGTLEVLAPILGAVILVIILVVQPPLPPYSHPNDIKERKRNNTLMTIIAVICPLIVGSAISAKIISSSLELLGFRQMNVSISLDESNQKIIQRIAAEFDLPLQGCESQHQEAQIIHHVNVLWHGVGERTLVEIPVLTRANANSAYQVELNRSGLNIVRRPSNKTSVPLCFSLNNDLLFDTYSSTLTGEGRRALDAFTVKIKDYLSVSKTSISSISVVGHTDRTPVLAAKDNNQKLSLRRAESVSMALQGLGEKNPEFILEGLGARAPRSKCPRTLPQHELRECLTVDRRVEIIIKTKANYSPPTFTVRLQHAWEVVRSTARWLGIN